MLSLFNQRWTTAVLLLWHLLPLLLLLLLQPAASQVDDPAYFYLYDNVVREYVSEGGQKEKNLFMDEHGPKVVEFYSPLCVSTCSEYLLF